MPYVDTFYVDTEQDGTIAKILDKSQKCYQQMNIFMLSYILLYFFCQAGQVTFDVQEHMVVLSAACVFLMLFSLANSITAGQLLCGGLFSADPLSNWFAAVALLHAIIENPTQKEQLLRVQLATSLGSAPVSLLQQCCNMLSQASISYNLIDHYLMRLVK